MNAFDRMIEVFTNIVTIILGIIFFPFYVLFWLLKKMLKFSFIIFLVLFVLEKLFGIPCLSYIIIFLKQMLLLLSNPYIV